MTNVLITGITGFIGSHLAKVLVNKGYNVYGIERHIPTINLKPIADILDKIVLINANLDDYSSVLHAVRSANPTYICHLGALTPVRLSFEYPFEFEQTNFKGTMNVIHSLLELPDFKKRQLIIASTAEVYGWQKEEKPFTEDLSLNPASPYAVSKAAADMYARMAMKIYDLNCTILRPSNTYGRKFETNFIVEYLITTMLKNIKPYVGASTSVRDYLFVDDHVNAYLTCIENNKSQGQVFNVSTGIATDNRKLAEMISKIINYDDDIIYGSYPLGYPRRPQYLDPLYMVLDSRKIQRILNWKPQKTLENGIKETADYWKKILSNPS